MLTDEPVLFGSLPAEAALDSPLYSSFGGKDAIERVRPKVVLPAPTAVTPPPKPTPFKLQGRTAFEKGRYSEAVSLFEKAHKAEPNAPDNLRAMAEAYARMGDKKAAVAALRSALKIAKNKGPIRRRIFELRRPHILNVVIPPKPFKVSEAI